MSDKNKFAMVAKSMASLEMMIIEGGGASPEIEAELRSLTTNIDLSAELIEQCESRSDYFRKKAAFFASVAKNFERAESYMRQMIKDDMIAHNITELLGTDVRFKLSNSKPKLVIDEATLDQAYIMHVPQPDKRKIEEALSLGLEVPGAQFEEVKALRSYVNKKQVTHE